MGMPTVVRQAVLTSLAGLTLACADPRTTSRAPTTPTPATPPASAMVWGFVADQTGACIAGAAVEIVGGQGLGQTAVQQTPCSVWDDPGAGFLFEDMVPGVGLTLRAKAPGYETQDATVTPPMNQGVALILRKVP